MKSSCNEQRAVIVFLWAKNKCKQIHFWMHSIYGDKRSEQFTFG